MNSPHHGYSNSHHAHPRDPTVDNMFDEFVTQPEEDVNHHNEIAEALEERALEDDNARRALDEFVH